MIDMPSFMPPLSPKELLEGDLKICDQAISDILLSKDNQNLDYLPRVARVRSEIIADLELLIKQRGKYE